MWWSLRLSRNWGWTPTANARVHSLDGLFESIHRVGAAVGRDERAAELVADLRERVAAVERQRHEARRRPAWRCSTGSTR